MKIKTRYAIISAVFLIFILISCESGFWDITLAHDSLHDVLSPNYIQVEIKKYSFESGFATITLSWEAPVEVVSYAGCEIWYGLNGKADTEFTGEIDPAGTEISGLENNKEYTIVIKTIDSEGHVSKGVTFTATTTQGSLPEGLDAGDVAIKKTNWGGDIISPNEHITTNTVYLEVRTVGHTNTEDFSLYYKIDGFHDEWQKLTGGDASISNIPDGHYSLDVEYIHDDEQAFHTEAVTPYPFNINCNSPTPVQGVKAVAGCKAVGIRWDERDDWDYDHVIVRADGTVLANVKDKNHCEISNLTNGNDYSFTVRVVDKAGNESDPVTTETVTPDRFITFGEDVTGSGNCFSANSAEDSEGNIYLAGYIGSGSEANGLLIALTKNLTPRFDTFSEGFLIFDNENGDIFYSCEIDSEDSIIVGGYTGYIGSKNPEHDCLVLRYKKDGQLDTTLGNNGVLRFGNDLSHPGMDSVYNICIDPAKDSFWCACGVQQSGRDWDPGVYSFNKDGSLNTAFDGDGFWYEEDHTISGRYNAPDAATNILKDGNYIYYSGITYNIDEHMNYDIWLMKKTLDGSPVTGWDNPVMIKDSIAEGEDDESIYYDAIEIIGNYIYAAGSSDGPPTNTPQREALIMKLHTSNGQVDTSFGKDGFHVYSGPTGDDCYTGMAYGGGNRIYVTGYQTTSENGRDFLIHAYITGGGFDNGFNSSGRFTGNYSNSGNKNDYATSIFINNEGSLICSGSTEVSPDLYAAAVWCIDPDNPNNP